jgi:hypothetical protein
MVREPTSEEDANVDPEHSPQPPCSTTSGRSREFPTMRCLSIASAIDGEQGIALGFVDEPDGG